MDVHGVFFFLFKGSVTVDAQGNQEGHHTRTGHIDLNNWTRAIEFPEPKGFKGKANTLVHLAWMVGIFTFLPTHGFSMKPLKVKLLAGEQKATENRRTHHPWVSVRAALGFGLQAHPSLCPRCADVVQELGAGARGWVLVGVLPHRPGPGSSSVARETPSETW